SPANLNGRPVGRSSIDEFAARHERETAELLQHRTKSNSDRIDSGELAIVGVTYKLSDGRAYLRSVLGDVEDVARGPGEEMVAI
ncbi:carbonic anhydrase, partial [Dietzia maris]